MTKKKFNLEIIDPKTNTIFVKEQHTVLYNPDIDIINQDTILKEILILKINENFSKIVDRNEIFPPSIDEKILKLPDRDVLLAIEEPIIQNDGSAIAKVSGAKLILKTESKDPEFLKLLDKVVIYIDFNQLAKTIDKVSITINILEIEETVNLNDYSEQIEKATHDGKVPELILLNTKQLDNDFKLKVDDTTLKIEDITNGSTTTI